MSSKEYFEARAIIRDLERNVAASIEVAMEKLRAVFEGEEEEPCATCDGDGTIPVLEHHSGPNLPPGGYDDVGDETRPCPDCQLK